MLHRASRPIIMTLLQKLVIPYIEIVLKNNFNKTLINMIIFIKLSLSNYVTYYSKICLKIKRPVIIRTTIIPILYRLYSIGLQLTMTGTVADAKKKSDFLRCNTSYIFFPFNAIHF